MDLDPLLLSRIQFGWTVSFHVLFPAFTIGLASWLAVLSGLWVTTNNTVYRDLYDFWIKIFAVSFGMGVVSGIVMAYQFGTNWSELSLRAGPVLGPLLSYEVVTAFFLEATFLGIMLFGRSKVPKWMHLFATGMVAVGTLLSTFWILSANSLMQAPAGVVIDENGILQAESWFEIVFNPMFPVRLAHMVLAAYLTTGFVIGGIGALYLLRGRFIPQARIMLRMAVGLIIVLAPLQILVGDFVGLAVHEHQPIKLAAMEGHWETRSGQPLVLFGIPDMQAQTNHFEIGIPNLSSLIITHDWNGEMTGLKDFPEDEWPPVFITFWTFRIMVLMGMLMAATGLAGALLWMRGTLTESRWFQRTMVAMIPSGFIAVETGWMTAEIGRQPWIIQDVLRTEDMVSPITGGAVAFSLAMFLLVYVVIFGSGLYYIRRIFQQGPQAKAAALDDPRTKPKRPFSAVAESMDEDGYRGPPGRPMPGFTYQGGD